MKSSAYFLFYRCPPIATPPPFLQENLHPPPSMVFQKSQPPINKGVHTMNITYDPLKQS